jgi:hypothetical protein
LAALGSFRLAPPSAVLLRPAVAALVAFPMRASVRFVGAERRGGGGASEGGCDRATAPCWAVFSMRVGFGERASGQSLRVLGAPLRVAPCPVGVALPRTFAIR